MEGGGVVNSKVPDAEVNQIVSSAIEQNVGTLRNRINEIGVAEPIIQRQGTNRVVVELPGVQDTAQAKRIIGATATLEYRAAVRSEEHTSELQSLMRISYAVFCLKKKNTTTLHNLKLLTYITTHILHTTHTITTSNTPTPK